MQAIQEAHNAERPLWISRQVLREYLVTMTRPQSFETPSKTVVLEQVELFSQQFHVANDTGAVTDQLTSLIQEYELGGKQVHDANIIATMLVYGIDTILTHNVKDFKRFNNRITVVDFVTA